MWKILRKVVGKFEVNKNKVVKIAEVLCLNEASEILLEAIRLIVKYLNTSQQPDIGSEDVLLSNPNRIILN